MADYDEKKAFDMASKMGENATQEDIENVEQNMSKMNRGPLAKIWDKVTKLWAAFKSPNTPTSLKVIIIGGLIYMISPIDLIPDPVPVFGLLDDVGVITYVFLKFLALGMVVSASIKLVKINEENIRIEMKKRRLEKLIIENIKNANECGGYGLKKDGTEEYLTFESSNGISEEIYEGRVLYAMY